MTIITDELVFQRLLSLERLRCERTESRFALLLIEAEDLTDDVGTAIAGSLRETDITGWYRYPTTLGVILTALNGTGRETLESVVVERTNAVLSLHIDPARLRQVRISCHLFPEDGVQDRIFYSEQDDKQVRKNHPTAPKRFLDLAGSLAALIVLFPVFLAIAALIKMTSKGPALFRQKRIGQFGREFTFLKFRSMYVNNDHAIHQTYVKNLIKMKGSDSGGDFKIKNDPRITPIGRFLRKSSLDELPQFINVLRGEMSLVGPRPPIPYEFESYSLWHRRRILDAKPGITGEWQVHGRSRTSFDEMVRMDLRYIRRQSIWLDLKILLKTPLAVITGNGAY